MGGHLKDLIGRLSDADMLAMKALIEAGRLAPPYTEAALLQFLPKERARATAAGLTKLAGKGASPELLAEILGAIHAERSAAAREDDLVELVWTGPESPDAPIRDTSVVVRDLFRTAHRKVIVAGFAVHGGSRLFAELAKRMEELPTLDVSLFLNVHRAPGDTSTADSILVRFAKDFKQRQWPAARLPKVYFDPRSLETQDETRASMHAKCIVADDLKAFVTSANFTDAAQRKNVEVGVLLNSPRLAKKLGAHFETLARLSHFQLVPGL